jgi:hypothetical protein
MNSALIAVTDVTSLIYFAYIVMVLVTDYLKHEKLVSFRKELAPWVVWTLPLNALGVVVFETNPWLKSLFLLANAYWAWVAWYDRDDRWKRRRKRALAKVKEVAGRLVVVPVTS